MDRARVTPTAVQGTNRFNLPSVPANYSGRDYRECLRHVNKVWMEEAKEEIDSLRIALSQSKRLNVQLQSLLEVDQELHPSNQRVTALQAQLVTAQGELETLRRVHANKVSGLDRRKALYDVLKARTEVQAQSMSAAIEAKDRELETFREGRFYDELSDETHHTRQEQIQEKRTILYVVTLKSCVSRYSSLKKTSTGRRGERRDRGERVGN